MATERVRGEHYSKKLKDLKFFLTEVIYPALEKNLDQAFPDFNFKRGPSGEWLAQSAPVSFRDYGHRQGKLIGHGWGFRSLSTGAPAVLWLSYLNKGQIPTGQNFAQCVKRLAAKAKITYSWEPSPEEIHDAEWQERRDHFLITALSFLQGALMADEGTHARRYLTRDMGLPPNRLAELELGLYPSQNRVRQALHEAGFNTEDDDNRARVLGVYHPEWEGRIVGPWWDLEGRNVINLWGIVPGRSLTDQSPCIHLNRPLDPNELFGSNAIPILLHKAKEKAAKKLVLLENPLHALLAYSKGIFDPFPVSTGGPLTQGQIKVLNEYLGYSGKLIVNRDYDPKALDEHAETVKWLDAIGETPFQVLVVDPVELSGKAGHPHRVDPGSYLRQKGPQDYRALLSKAKDVAHYRPNTGVRRAAKRDQVEEDPDIGDFVPKQEQKGWEPDLLSVVHEEVDSSGPVSEGGEKTPEIQAFEEMLEEAKFQLNLYGAENAAEFLANALSEKYGIGTASPAAKDWESATRAPEPLPSSAALQALSGDLEKQAETIRDTFVGVAFKVGLGEVSPSQGLALLLKCQDGITTLTKSLQVRTSSS